jgi:hypothetical protein
VKAWSSAAIRRHVASTVRPAASAQQRLELGNICSIGFRSELQGGRKNSLAPIEPDGMAQLGLALVAAEIVDDDDVAGLEPRATNCST